MAMQRRVFLPDDAAAEVPPGATIAWTFVPTTLAFVPERLILRTTPVEAAADLVVWDVRADGASLLRDPQPRPAAEFGTEALMGEGPAFVGRALPVGTLITVTLRNPSDQVVTLTGAFVGPHS